MTLCLVSSFGRPAPLLRGPVAPRVADTRQAKSKNLSDRQTKKKRRELGVQPASAPPSLAAPFLKGIYK
jgi:hypothetical protein